MSRTMPSPDELFSDIIERYSTCDPWDTYPFLDAAAPVAFEHLFIPFAIAAGEWLREQCPGLDNVLEERAFIDLQRHLLDRMSQMASRTLALELTALKAVGSSSGWLAAFAVSSTEMPADSYRKLMERWYADPGGTLFAEYPELSRQLAAFTQDWIRNCAAFIERLSADWSGIHEKLLDLLTQPQRVHRIRSVSDPHRRGRSVLELTFGHGGKVMYKPKSLEPDRAFGELLIWMKEQGAPVDLVTAPILSMPGYGWTAFIHPEPCRDEREIELYYRRAGALLCLFYILSGTDFHYENIIAFGSCPVAVDLETLLTPSLAEPDNSRSASFKAKQMLDDSVVHTLFLPMCKKIAGVAFNRGGLGSEADLPSEHHVWHNINTDGMRLAVARQEQPVTAHLPQWNGRFIGLHEYLPPFHEGFESMYRFMMFHKEVLLSPESPLEFFKGISVRSVRRNTPVYMQLLDNASYPTNMKEAAPYWEKVKQRLLSQADVSLHDIIEDEILQMKCGDVPYFYALTDRMDLFGAYSAGLSGILKEAPYDRLKNKISQLCERDLKWQSSLIEIVLEAWQALKSGPSHNRNRTSSAGGWTNEPDRTAHAGVSDRSGPATIPLPDIPLPSEQELLRHAVEIADHIEALAIEGEDGSLTWIAADREDDSFALKELPFGLYEGQVGVALFFAAMYRVKGEGKYRRLAERSLLELERESRTEPCSKRVVDMPHHLAGGKASIVYGLTVLSGLLDDSRWLELARDFANDLAPHRWEQAAIAFPDVLLGKPGIILSLVKIFEQTGDDKLIEWAKQYGEELLERRVETESRYEDWFVRRYDHNWTGFSHGAAGIALTLLRLHQVTKEDRWLQSAVEAIRYEQEQFIQEKQIWPDYRVDPPDQGMHHSWCHGSAGIGLARIAGLSFLQTEAVMHDIDVAIRDAAAHPTEQQDHLCCGNLGRVELLLAAYQAFGHKHLWEAALRIAADVMHARDRHGRYRLNMNSEGCVGFFQGLSGIGYSLLRLRAPDRLPSILIFD